MELHHLWLFHKVAQNLSFSKTAQELNISQSAISIQIKKLEDTIGLQLFERYGKNIYLTKYGEFLYSYTQQIFHLIDELTGEIELIKGKMVGSLNIGASNTPGIYILPSIMGIFKEKYPDVTTNLYIGSTHEIKSMIMMNEIDFAVIGGDLDLPKTFAVEKLAEDLMVLILSPKNHLSTKRIINTGELLNEHFILHEPNSNLYNAIKKILTKELHVPFNVSMTLGSIDAIKHAVSANLGITMAPLTAVREDIRLGKLTSVNIENKVWKYAYSLVYFQNKNFNVPENVMIGLIKEKINQIVSV